MEKWCRCRILLPGTRIWECQRGRNLGESGGMLPWRKLLKSGMLETPCSPLHYPSMNWKKKGLPPGLPQGSCPCSPEQCTYHVKPHWIPGNSMILTPKYCNLTVHDAIDTAKNIWGRLFHNDSNLQFDSVVYHRHAVIDVLELALIAIHLSQKYILPFTHLQLGSHLYDRKIALSSLQSFLGSNCGRLTN